ncbi:MAG TPA: type III polyketide synthase [Chloroflexota bacterium]|nr:type III polyketide synthase [Chloroflexota bacterium]
MKSGDPRVVATATRAPAHVIGPDETKRCIRQIFGSAYPDLQRATRMVDHTGIDERHLSLPLPDLLAERTLAATQEIYAETVRTLGRETAAAALDEARVSADQVDCVIAVSCTGYMIPSLDVYLASELGMRADVRRLPITELGCGGGTAALALAADFVRARPGSVVLVVSVELCSLTFQKNDPSWQNVVAAMLFGDAAAAVVVADRGSRPGPTIRAARSHLFPDTRSYMGFELRDSGLHLIMSPEVPEMVRKHFRPLRDTFLADHGLAPTDVDFYVLHPGGAKILRYLRQYGEVPDCWLAPAAEILRRYGNTSSTSVLLVLDEVVRHHAPREEANGIVASLGPGFCAELILLGWEG